LRILQPDCFVMTHSLTRAELNDRRGQISKTDTNEEGKVKYVTCLLNTAISAFDENKPYKIAANKTEPLPSLEDLTLGNVQEWLQWRRSEKVCIFRDAAGHQHAYSIRFPSDFERQRKTLSCQRSRWPLLVWLHGAGGNTFFTQTKKSLQTQGLQFAADHFIVVSPHCRWTWKQSPGQWVLELVQSLRLASWVDESRIYLSGCSMGGMGTWQLAAEQPSLFAAVAPVAAHHHLDARYNIAQALQRVPILAVASLGDETCPIQEERILWQLLLERDATLQVEISHNLDHLALFDAAFCDSTFLYRWLLMFRNTQRTGDA